MEIIFLGTTAAVPSSKRGHVAIALKYHDEVILWDCGEGTQKQLIKSNASYMKIKKIFITHFHGDHFLGLPGLIQTLGFMGRVEPLHIYGPPGVGKIVRSILKLGRPFDRNFEIFTHRIYDGFVLDEKMYRIRCVRVEHSAPAFGLIFEEKKDREFLVEKALELGLKPGPVFSRLQRGETVKLGEKEILPDDVLGDIKPGFKVVYSSDTRPCKNIEQNCKDAWLIHESTFDSESEENARDAGHSTCVDAAKIAKNGGARKLFLIHISPRYKSDEILHRQARDIFENTVVTRDLMMERLKL